MYPVSEIVPRPLHVHSRHDLSDGLPLWIGFMTDRTRSYGGLRERVARPGPDSAAQCEVPRAVPEAPAGREGGWPWFVAVKPEPSTPFAA